MNEQAARRETYQHAKQENLIRRQARQCTCEIYGRDDPDCELHHPDVIEDESARRLALQYYYIGFDAGQIEAIEFARCV